MKLPTLVAHRGLHHHHTENTLPALHAAWDAGFTWCEIDLRGSLDHEPFLMHDETVERTTVGAWGRIDEYPSAKLREIGVPTFQELMAMLPSQARLMVEIKPKVHYAAVNRILELCDPSRCIIQSFGHELLRYAADQRRDIELHLLVDDAKEIEGGPWNAINANFKTLDAATALQIRNFGFGVGAWTPNTPEDMRQMIELKMDRIITDEPTVLRDILKQIGVKTAGSMEADKDNKGDKKEESTGLDFIRRMIEEDNRTNRWGGRVATRFPPEPNGYLHIGHAKSICLNFGVAEEYRGTCNLRYDDTNPAKEEEEYVKSIEADVRWLGFSPANVIWASDYFDTMYEYAVELIKKGLAYVDDQSADQIRKSRGSLTAGGNASPFRDRPVEENLDLLDRMRKGEFPDGSKVLRAKIDMASPNVNLRDPVMYRILHESHHNTGDKWCIYPMYDWAHGFEDSLEKITHSLCTLEFENHRPLYDWFIDAVNKDRPKDKQIWHPQQTEFARLNLTYTMLSKRKLLALVEEKIVSDWDDPRMPTISGFRRRGYTPQAIRAFCKHIGMNKFDSTVEINVLENFLRDDLNKRAPRRMAVLRPLKVIIDNYPEGKSEELDAINNPEDESAGTRKVPFSRVLYIEQDDFREVPPPKYFRLAPGVEVRLRYAYFVKCVSVEKDASGNVTEVHCTYDPATRGGDAPDGRKVKGTIHWVSAQHAVAAEVRLYDHLFKAEFPEDVPEGQDWRVSLNPNSLDIVQARLESNLKSAKPGETFQFERLGYFTIDKESPPEQMVINRTVTLKDTWAKEEKKGAKK